MSALIFLRTPSPALLVVLPPPPMIAIGRRWKRNLAEAAGLIILSYVPVKNA